MWFQMVGACLAISKKRTSIFGIQAPKSSISENKSKSWKIWADCQQNLKIHLWTNFRFCATHVRSDFTGNRRKIMEPRDTPATSESSYSHPRFPGYLSFAIEVWSNSNWNNIIAASIPQIPEVNRGSTFALRRPHSRPLSRWATLFEGVPPRQTSLSTLVWAVRRFSLAQVGVVTRARLLAPREVGVLLRGVDPRFQ
jgi:hypothetical protein